MKIEDLTKDPAIAALLAFAHAVAKQNILAIDPDFYLSDEEKRAKREARRAAEAKANEGRARCKYGCGHFALENGQCPSRTYFYSCSSPVTK